MQSADFLTFSRELSGEIGSENYCTDIRVSGITTAILTLTFRFDIPLLSICGEFMIPEQEPILGMWQLSLDREKIQEHLEDELNIYLNHGIRAFGQLFGKALKSSLGPDLGSVGADKTFPLKLDYVISGRQYVGILRIPLVQSNLDKRIFDMMNFIRFSNPEQQSCTKRSFQILSQPISQGISHHPLKFEISPKIDQRDIEPPDDESESVPPHKTITKKRRTGGISVNPSRRKK